MKNTNKAKPVSVFVIVASVIISCANMYYTADKVASGVGYFIALAIIPAATGIILGSIGSTILEGSIVKGIKSFWWVPLTGAIAALVPVAYVVFVMSQPNH